MRRCCASCRVPLSPCGVWLVVSAVLLLSTVRVEGGVQGDWPLQERRRAFVADVTDRTNIISHGERSDKKDEERPTDGPTAAENFGLATTLKGSERNGSRPIEQNERKSESTSSSNRSIHSDSVGNTPRTEGLSSIVVLGQIVVFLIIGSFSLQQTFRIISKDRLRPPQSGMSASQTPQKTRLLLTILLLVADTARVVSLTVMWLLDGKWAPRQSAAQAAGGFLQSDWMQYFLQSFPSLIFLSAYSVLVFFLAQMYYSAILYSLPLLRPIFGLLNLALYSVYIIIGVLTYECAAYTKFRSSTALFVESLFFVVSIAFAYFGIKVANRLSACKSTSSSPPSSVVKRVLFLAIMCPLLFAPRGLYYMAYSVKLIVNYYPPCLSALAWDSLIFFVSEGLPSLLIVASFWLQNTTETRSGYFRVESGPINHFLGGATTNLGQGIDALTSPLIYYNPHQVNTLENFGVATNQFHTDASGAKVAQTQEFEGQQNILAEGRSIHSWTQQHALYANGGVPTAFSAAAVNQTPLSTGYFRPQDFT